MHACIQTYIHAYIHYIHYIHYIQYMHYIHYIHYIRCIHYIHYIHTLHKLHTLHTLHTYITYIAYITYITYIHTCIRTYIHSYIHTFIHSYIHTFIHTYLYTCIFDDFDETICRWWFPYVDRYFHGVWPVPRVCLQTNHMTGLPFIHTSPLFVLLHLLVTRLENNEPWTHGYWSTFSTKVVDEVSTSKIHRFYPQISWWLY